MDDKTIKAAESILSRGERVELIPVKDGVKVVRVRREEVGVFLLHEKWNTKEQARWNGLTSTFLLSANVRHAETWSISKTREALRFYTTFAPPKEPGAKEKENENGIYTRIYPQDREGKRCGASQGV